MHSQLTELGGRVRETGETSDDLEALDRVQARAAFNRTHRRRVRGAIATPVVALLVLGVSYALIESRSTQPLQLSTAPPSEDTAAVPSTPASTTPMPRGVHISIPDSDSPDPAEVTAGPGPAGWVADQSSMADPTGARIQTSTFTDPQAAVPTRLTVSVRRADVSPGLLAAWEANDPVALTAAAAEAFPLDQFEAVDIDGRFVLAQTGLIEAPAGIAPLAAQSVIIIAGPDTTITVTGSNVSRSDILAVVAGLHLAPR